MVLRSRGLPFAAFALRCSAAQKCRQPGEGANPPPSPARTSRCARGGSPPRVWRWGWSRRRPRRGSAGRRHPPLLRCGRFSCSACCSARRRLLAASPQGLGVRAPPVVSTETSATGGAAPAAGSPAGKVVPVAASSAAAAAAATPAASVAPRRGRPSFARPVRAQPRRSEWEQPWLPVASPARVRVQRSHSRSPAGTPRKSACPTRMPWAALLLPPRPAVAPGVVFELVAVDSALGPTPESTRSAADPQSHPVLG